VTTTGCIRKIARAARELSPERQRTVLDFVGYLLSVEATEDVLSDPELMGDLRASDEDLAAGRFVRWDEVKDSL
jgi:hypothetical protein